MPAPASFGAALDPELMLIGAHGEIGTGRIAIRRGASTSVSSGSCSQSTASTPAEIRVADSSASSVGRMTTSSGGSGRRRIDSTIECGGSGKAAPPSTTTSKSSWVSRCQSPPPGEARTTTAPSRSNARRTISRTATGNPAGSAPSARACAQCEIGPGHRGSTDWTTARKDDDA